MAPSKKTVEQMVQLPSNDIGYACFRIIGETPLLVNCFNQKSFEQMLARMTGYSLPRQNKDLDAEYKRAFVKNVEGVECIPAPWIRSAMESSTPRSKKMVAATVLRSAVFICGKSLPILSPKTFDKAASRQHEVEYADAQQQIDIVRVGSFGSKQPDVRARPCYDEWALEFVVRYVPDQIELRSIAWALDAAGKFVGLCEWRPEKSGEYGMFRVEALPESNYDRILKQSQTPMPRHQVPPWLATAANDAGKSMGEVIGNVRKDRKKNGVTMHGEV